MASSLRTKLRIAASVLLGFGFWDALAGRFVFQPGASSGDASSGSSDTPAHAFADLSGALHIHSTYSDGAGDIPTVMNAACEAGVDFVLLTDHNTQQPLRDGWESRYEDKPLLLIGTEVTVEQGAFLLALDMPPDWEPTKGQPPQTAIDEINAHGGMPLVSLPFDVKHPWRDWEATGYAGLEVVNVSTIARWHINPLSLTWFLPLYRKRGAMAVIRALLTRPDAALARWDSLTAGGKRQMVGIGALDAHALMKIGKKKHPIPSYADSFRTATTHVLIAPEESAESGSVKRRAIYSALRAGRCYFSYDCLGDPTGFTFSATNGGKSAAMGERIALGTGGVNLRAQCVVSNEESARVLLQVYCEGKVIAAGSKGQVAFTATRSGAYRVEAYRYAFRLGPFFVGARPWIFTNPIYVA